MSKIREGVILRSLEQKSPLNIYVEEADRRFEILKRNVAHKVVISIHRMYIPNIQSSICERFHEDKLLSDAKYNEMKTKLSASEKATKAIRINLADFVKNKNTTPIVVSADAKVPPQGAAKEQLIKQQQIDKTIIANKPDKKPIIKTSISNENKDKTDNSSTKIVER
ncbi:MAG: hypothetical protein MJ223_00935 [Mycoplasmoidaceae bacterium]|nr:hypothetical protein [Mycoplasmoidaceae bacterium]